MAPRLSVSGIWLPCLVLLVLWARPAAAFGAGNIASVSSIEGQKWRHGDIEDTLLTLLISTRTNKKFSKMDVKRVYFGNWLRDYSQAVDVGTVKNISAEAIRILLWVLGFMSFGYGTKEFEVTRDRLGCYRPEEHIDNPKDYADNLDARDYDRRLRGPVDERRELAVDERTGLKNYIASEDLGITTSAGMVRDLLRRCIDLGRRSGGHGPDFYEALRLLGTATHCLEDYSAHSNYIELALIELGCRDVFPHVGRNARFHVQATRKEVYPIVTGTFGGVDFLHSVCGELTDKATQSELQELQGAISDADRTKNKSAIKDLLSKLPPGVFGGKDEAGKADELENHANAAAMGNIHITPKEPEAFTKQIGQLVKQIYPIMEWHDEIFKSIAAFVEKIPILPELIEQIQDQITVFVFSLLAPYVLPIMDQVKTELEEGSSEVIASSRDKQHIVFNDDRSTDPTHSMLSKDHFSNVLNEPAGRVASATIAWAVPQIVQCWDGQGDPEQTITRIIDGVFHHPAAVNSSRYQGRENGRIVMFDTVKQWWERQGNNQRELLQRLSRDGVERGENHKGPPDKGHGCGKPLGMAKNIGGGAAGGDLLGNILSGVSGGSSSNPQAQHFGNQASKLASDAVGGGAIGGILGGLVGGIGGSLLGGAFGESEKKTSKQEGYRQDGSYTQSYSETGSHQATGYGDSNRYGQAQYRATQYPSGGSRQEYAHHEQDSRGGSYSYQQKVETTGYGSSGGYERREERHVKQGGEWRSEEKHEGYNPSRGYYSEKKQHRGKSENSSDDEDSDEKRQKKEHKEREKREKEEQKRSGGHRKRSKTRSRSRERQSHRKKSKSRSRSCKRESGGYGQEQNYGQESSGYGRQEQLSHGRQEQPGYGRQEQPGYGRQEQSGYGRQEQPGYGRQEQPGYGRQEQPGYGRQEQPGYGRQEQPGYGRQQPGYGRQEYGGCSSEYGHQQSSGYGNDSYSSGGGRQESSGHGGDSYNSGAGYGRQESSGYQSRETESCGEQSQSYGSRDDEQEEYGERRQQQYGSGGYGRDSGGGYGEVEHRRRY